MDRDCIKEVGIDGEGRLYVIPSEKEFPYIYREAMDVQWNADSGALVGGTPREWSHSRWYEQILAAAAEQSCTLELSSATHWSNVPQDTKSAIEGQRQ
jgi:hypothetical protein